MSAVVGLRGRVVGLRGSVVEGWSGCAEGGLGLVGLRGGRSGCVCVRQGSPNRVTTRLDIRSKSMVL